jgi:hypothetical protein
MTVDYSKIAAFDVRNAIWETLKSFSILDVQDYYADGFPDPLVPIIPSQQVPEFNNLLPGKPYITYDIVQKNYGVQWWVSEESMVMQIVSRNNAQIITISNFLTDLFRRYELSARDINDFAKASGSPFTFLYFKLESANPIQPFIDEGGYMSGDFSITYTYTREVDEGINNTGKYI